MDTMRIATMTTMTTKAASVDDYRDLLTTIVIFVSFVAKAFVNVVARRNRSRPS